MGDHPVLLAPSILAADFGHLADQAGAALAAGADWLHVDVMDGHFVPNITIGPLVVRALRSLRAAHNTRLDVHLMIDNPDSFIDAFADAGAAGLTVHVEACRHLHRTVQAIKERGLAAGVAVNPATPLEAVGPILPELDLLLVMSVNPGFGGQSYIPGSTARLARARAMLDDIGSDAWLQIDGGIKPSNAAEVAAAGADVLVAGSAIFKGEGASAIADNVAAFRAALAGR